MTDQTATRELTHLLRNLDSLVRLRLAVGDRVEDVAKALRERGADEYLIGLIVPPLPLETRMERAHEKTKELGTRARVALWESEVNREVRNRLLTEQRKLREEMRQNLSN